MTRPTMRFSTFASVAVLSAALLGPASAQTGAKAPPAPAPAAQVETKAETKTDPAKVVARVDGGPITEGDLAMAEDDPALSLPGMDAKQKRDVLVGYLIDLKLGANAALKAKIGDSPDFARKLAYLREKLLLDEYLESEVKKAVTPEATKKLYEETVKSMKPEEEVRARHILVETEDEAKKVEARLKAGEDFAKIAGEMSKDPGSKTDGGELGWFTKDRMVAPFAEAAFKLQPNQISAPVKSQFGWHVIQVEEKRTKPVPSFDEMKDQVEAYLTRKTQQDLILGLRQAAKIDRLDEEGKPIPAAPATGKPDADAPKPDAGAPAQPKK